jgi:hypothetical protein
MLLTPRKFAALRHRLGTCEADPGWTSWHVGTLCAQAEMKYGLWTCYVPGSEKCM